MDINLHSFVKDNIVCVEKSLFYDSDFFEKILDWLLLDHVHIELPDYVPYLLYDCNNRFNIYIPANVRNLSDVVSIVYNKAELPSCLMEFPSLTKDECILFN